MFPRKKKGTGFFFDIGDIEDEFERIRQEMERMMGDMFRFSEFPEEVKEERGPKGERIIRRGPFVYGFSMRVGPDGKPQFQEFGNVKPMIRAVAGGEGAPGEMEPLVDVIQEKEVVTVIAELPGVAKEDIHLKATEDKLSIKVDTPERKYSKTVHLPVKVKPETAKASYKNGVLDVKIQRREPGKEEKGSEIKVE
ncbi:MAG: archaeal heat shock protein Hsp20 [Candidatus Micrarchaeia archaeon]